MAQFVNTPNGVKSGSAQDYALVHGPAASGPNADDLVTNWGSGASRSLYSVHSNPDLRNVGRNLLQSRLWHGVPQLTEEQMGMFEAAHTGHQFMFVVGVPKFMTTGIYHDTLMHQHMKNLKAVIERASTAFNGATPIEINPADMEDGNERKVSHAVSVSKNQQDITLTLHEFAGLPVKNALEAWVTGIFDYRSEHGNYFGNLGIPGGWCLANHTMSLLVVQVDPSWTVIQDAAYYYNMFPTSIPFDHFEWTKGQHDLIDSLPISFKCNEERSPMITYAAERYMNNRILSMVGTSVYNSRQFVVNNFMDHGSTLEYEGFKTNVSGSGAIIDRHEYNETLTNIDYDDKNKLYQNDEKKSALEMHEEKSQNPDVGTVKYTNTPFTANS